MTKLPVFLFAVFLTGQLYGQTKSSIDFGNGVVLSAWVEPFKADHHSYDTCDTGHEWKTICLIDGRIWFGTDEGLDIPKNQLTKMIIQIDGKEIELDVSGMYNPSFTGN